MDYFKEFLEFSQNYLAIGKIYFENLFDFFLKNVFPQLYRLEALAGVSICLTALISYKIGSKLARSKILIDKDLRLKFENVEKTKQKYNDICKSKSERIALVKSLSKLLYLLTVLLTLGYFFYPSILFSVLPWVEENPFLLILIIIPIVFLSVVEKIIRRKRDENMKKYQQIEEESVKVSEKILDLIGPQLGKLLKSYLLKVELENPKCKPLCEMKEKVYNVDLKRHHTFLQRLSSFNWCPWCIQNYSQNFGAAQNQGAEGNIPEGDRVDVQPNVQLNCGSNCLKRYFAHCSVIGKEFNEKDKELEEERAKIQAEEKKYTKTNTKT